MPSPLERRLAHLAASERVALRDDAGERSFSALFEGALRARAIFCEGVSSLEGRRVAILASPGAGWVEAFLGVVLGGGVAVPLSPLYPAAELAWFLDDAGAQVLVASEDLRARAEALGKARVVGLEELGLGVRVAGDEAALSRLRGDDTALLLYTSGTTGRPKGALITHANLAVQGELLREAWGYRESDVLLHALPLHHLHGLGISLLTSVLAGATTRMLPRFEARRVWEELAGATAWMAVPTMYQKLFEAFDAATDEERARWSRSARALRLATSGSAALPVTLAARWQAITGAIPLERFGMTEIGVGMTNPLEPAARRAGHVGRPLRTVELRLVDEAGEDASGSSGEIWIRGPSVFPGYFQREDATRAAFAEGGWFKTGDLAERSEEGELRILGRTSVDILKSGGYKLSALEIEEALREHGAIAEVAVIGVPDDTWGDRVVAVVVARAGREGELALEPLRGWAKERLAPYKIPREVILVSALPRNAVGKVVKPELVRAHAAGALARQRSAK